MPVRPFPAIHLDYARAVCQAHDMNGVSNLLNVVVARSGVLGQNTLEAEKGKELTVEDLGLLATTKIGGVQVLKRIRASHHQAARLLAQGCKPGEVSALSGFCPSRISVLQSDPAFSELVAHYTDVEQTTYVNVQERMVSLALGAGEELLDRLDNNPDLITNKELVDVMKAGLDRGGHAPIAKSETKNLSVVLGAEDLAALKSAGGVTTIIDKASIHGKDSMEETAPASEEPPVGETSLDRPVRNEEASSPRCASEGATV